MEKSYNQIKDLFFPDLIMSSVTAKSFFKIYKGLIDESRSLFTDIPIQFVISRFITDFPIIMQRFPPILFFSAKTAKSSKAPQQIVLIGYEDEDQNRNMQLFSYNCDTNEIIKHNSCVVSIIQETENSILIGFLNSSTIVYHLTKPVQNICEFARRMWRMCLLSLEAFMRTLSLRLGIVHLIFQGRFFLLL